MATVASQRAQTASQNNASSKINNANSASATTDTSTDYDSGYPENGKAWSDLPTSSSFGNSIYAGAVTFATPTRSGSVLPLYPIQSAANVTFKWGYTALRVRPVNLTLNAVGPNSETVDITAIDGSATEAVWNFGSLPTETPLINGYYKIQLYDQRGVSVDYSPGWMVPCTTLSIALYSPDFYDPITTMTGYCPTCFYNAGSSFHEAFVPIAAATGIALITSVLVLANVLVICSGRMIDKQAHNYAYYNKSSDPSSAKIRRPMMRMKNQHGKPNMRPGDLPSAAAAATASINVSALPTSGVFDHTNRPGTIEWKMPKLTFPQQDKSSKNVILGPVYRLPVDNDDAGAQIDLRWTYTNLKVRPERLTIEAVGPNKATWAVSVMEGTVTSATWDLRATPSYTPLIEGYYTLQVHDQRGPDSLPKPGWLLPDNKMRVALYKTENNNHVGEKIAPFECATCFNYVMKGMDNEMRASANRTLANYVLMMIILFLWTLL
ncbi:hypothetical protein [Parasitella parasitica]|uniref:DUF7137 domain-containing protein n=1 Tax=Parasitella parasitica TaxID=35722 RepID=A0A0B7N3L2_9FUNG|nr:hypothetical protein [Parasitella parasitica]